jgi:hypothetical protein
MADIVLPELADAVYRDRIRDAKKNRKFSDSRETGRLPLVLRNLLLLFARS